MARENKVSIKILLDSEEAKQRLQDLQKRLDELLDRSDSVGSQSTEGTQKPSSESNVIAEQTNKTIQQVSQKEGENFGRNAGRGLEKAAPSFVGALVKAGIGKMLSNEILKLYDLNVMSRTHAGQSMYDLNMEQSKIKGGFSGLLTGGALGLSVAGPLGMLVGALGGSALGGWYAIRKQVEKQRIFAEQTQLSTGIANSDSMASAMNSMSNSAFQHGLQLTGTREGRLEEYDKRFQMFLKEITQLEATEKEWTTTGKLKTRQKKEMVPVLDNNGKVVSYEERETGETEDYYEVQDSNSADLKNLQKRLDLVRGNAIGSLTGAFNEKYLQNRIPPWMAGEFSDSFAARGISVGGGAGFDMEKANEPIVRYLADINKTLQDFKTGGYIKTTSTANDIRNFAIGLDVGIGTYGN